MKTTKQTFVLSEIIDILKNIKDSSDFEAPYHLSDIDNSLEDLVEEDFLTEKQANDLSTKIQAVLSCVLKIK